MLAERTGGPLRKHPDQKFKVLSGYIAGLVQVVKPLR